MHVALNALFRGLVLLGGLGLHTFLLYSQSEQPPPSSYGLISGTVVDGATDAPVRRVVVTLSTIETRPKDAVAWTDDQGRFAFGYLPAGRYELKAQKDGYQIAVFGKDTEARPSLIIVLAQGETRADCKLRLHRFSSISGTVVDDDGDPVGGVMLTAIRRAPRATYDVPGKLVSTDVHGRYKFSRLEPGVYAILAEAPDANAPSLSAEASPTRQQKRAYVPQYYPGTDRLSAAEYHDLSSGKQLDKIDFRLVARPLHAVRGHIVLPLEISSIADPVPVTLSGGTAMPSSDVSARPPQFAFEFTDVAEGTYLLTAQIGARGKQFRGNQHIDVCDELRSDILVSIQAGITLTGTVLVAGPEADKYPASYIDLISSDSTDLNRALETSVHPDGSFKFENVPIGMWDVRVGPVPRDGYIKSMRLGDKDVLADEMEITSTTQGPLNIVIATNGAVIQGDVTNRSGDPARAIVVLAPQPPFRDVRGLYKWNTGDEKGHFNVRGVAPGTYKIYAFEEFSVSMMPDAQMLKAFEDRGFVVQVSDTETVTQNLVVIPARKSDQ